MLLIILREASLTLQDLATAVPNLESAGVDLLSVSSYSIYALHGKKLFVYVRLHCNLIVRLTRVPSQSHKDVSMVYGEYCSFPYCQKRSTLIFIGKIR